MSQFSDAIMGNMASSLDPMTSVVREFSSSMVKEKALDFDIRSLEFVAKVEALLEAAVERGARPSVISNYEKMLAKYQ